MPRESEMYLRRLGRRLRDLRRRRQLTQADVADRAGVSVNYISELERGLRNPTLLTLHRIATAGLGADPGEIVATAPSLPGTSASYPTEEDVHPVAGRVAERPARPQTKSEIRLATLVAGASTAHRRRLRAVLRALADVLK